MPRIPDPSLRSVIYLYPSEHDAENGVKAGGSGFIVFVPSASGPGHVYMYAMTNRHIVDIATTIRMTAADGQMIIINTRREQWVNHPDMDDIAAVSLPEIPGGTYGFSTDMFLTQETFDAVQLGPGDPVFMMGRFIAHDGKQTNQPIARFGNIGMNPTSVQHEYGFSQESFLVEMRSLSGFSGSPVFVYLEPDYARPKTAKNPATQGIWFLGIDWCHLTVTEPVRGKDTQPLDDGTYVRSNSGVAGVIPAWRVLDLLNVDEFAMTRKHFEDELAKKPKKESR